MAHSFQVGTSEQHTLTLVKNWWTGAVILRAKGRKIGGKLTLVGGRKQIEAVVGEEEKHAIRIVVEVPALLGWAQSWSCDIYVDEILIETVLL